MRRASRISTGERPAGRGVEPCDEALLVRGAKGKAGYERQAAASKTWQPKHRDGGAGVKPRSREAVRHFPQGFTREDIPGEDEWWRGGFDLAVAV
jgi:hypothetical protein